MQLKKIHNQDQMTLQYILLPNYYHTISSLLVLKNNQLNFQDPSSLFVNWGSTGKGC